MGFSFKKLIKNFDKIVGKLGIDAGAILRLEDDKKKQAQNEAKRRESIAAQQANMAAENLRRNLGVDLNLQNVANVEAGGTASMLDAAEGDLKKKRGSGVALSSTLGIRA